MLLIKNMGEKKHIYFPPQKTLPNYLKNSRACVLSQVDNIYINQVFLVHLLIGNLIAKGVLMIHLLMERPEFVHTTDRKSVV